MDKQEKIRLWTFAVLLSITALLTFSHTILLQTYVANDIHIGFLIGAAFGLAVGTSAILHLLPSWYYYIPIAAFDGFSIALKTWDGGTVAAIYYGLFLAALIAAVGRINEQNEANQPDPDKVRELTNRNRELMAEIKELKANKSQLNTDDIKHAVGKLSQAWKDPKNAIVAKALCDFGGVEYPDAIKRKLNGSANKKIQDHE